MALPEKPLARRETYLAKAAGQDVTLPEKDITREEMYLRAIAEGGGGGGVTPEYVAQAIAEAKTDIEAEIPTKTSDLTNDSGYTAIDDTTAAQNKAYSSAKVEEKVAGEEITTTATGFDLTLSTSSGNVNALTVYGKSEVVDGSIKSAGEGYAVVDLGALDWYPNATYPSIFNAPSIFPALKQPYALLYCSKYKISTSTTIMDIDKSIANSVGSSLLYVKDTDYTDVAAFKAAMSGVILCYELADPTQGNIIAVKTDNGSGIDGTMATFTTGTPLRGITGGARDVAEWDGVSGAVTKNCDEAKLANLTWGYSTQYTHSFFAGTLPTASQNVRPSILSANYIEKLIFNDMVNTNKSYCIVNNSIRIRDDDYNTVEDFIASLGDAELVYELATPTTEQLTTAENASIAGLRTYEPQTHAQNNAGATMTVEAYAGTANGKAVNELKQDVQSEISALKITQSSALTLTTAGWTNNTQTIAYAHDTAKRNVIDVDPSSVEEWASCGVLATAETASGITFTCKTVPTSALNFRVTSMGVN